MFGVALLGAAEGGMRFAFPPYCTAALRWLPQASPSPLPLSREGRGVPRLSLNVLVSAANAFDVPGSLPVAPAWGSSAGSSRTGCPAEGPQARDGLWARPVALDHQAGCPAKAGPRMEGVFLLVTSLRLEAPTVGSQEKRSNSALGEINQQRSTAPDRRNRRHHGFIYSMIASPLTPTLSPHAGRGRKDGGAIHGGTVVT